MDNVIERNRRAINHIYPNDTQMLAYLTGRKPSHIVPANVPDEKAHLIDALSHKPECETLHIRWWFCEAALLLIRTSWPLSNRWFRIALLHWSQHLHIYIFDDRNHRYVKTCRSHQICINNFAYFRQSFIQLVDREIGLSVAWNNEVYSSNYEMWGEAAQSHDIGKLYCIVIHCQIVEDARSSTCIHRRHRLGSKTECGWLLLLTAENKAWTSACQNDASPRWLVPNCLADCFSNASIFIHVYLICFFSFSAFWSLRYIQIKWNF